MRRPWLKFSLLVILLVSIVFIGSKHTVWASSQAAPLGQTVPTRIRTNTSAPVIASPTSQPPVRSAPTNTQVPRLLISTSTHTLTITTLKPPPTKTDPATPTITITQPAPTVVETVTKTVTSIGFQATPMPQSTPAIGNSMVLPAAGGLFLTLLGVLAVIIWRKRTH